MPELFLRRRSNLGVSMIITLKWPPFASRIKSRYLAKRAATIWTQTLLFTSWPFYLTFPNSVMFFKHAALLALSYVCFYAFLSLSQIYIYIYLSTYIYHIFTYNIYILTYEYISVIYICIDIYLQIYVCIQIYVYIYIFSKIPKILHLVSCLKAQKKLLLTCSLLSVLF